MDANLLEISDGKLYENNDMVKVSCRDCTGCSSCCRDMGESIWLDPYDVYQLTRNLGKSFEALLTKEVELHVEDGLIMPNLRMMGEGELACGFLNNEGRCSIHAFRPGLCRLFPLGRNYEGDRLSYFILRDACPAPNKTKVKINKWLGVPKLRDYEKFLIAWHGLTKGIREIYEEHKQEEAIMKAINMKFLQTFYLTAYEEESFYVEFESRLLEMQTFLTSLGL